MANGDARTAVLRGQSSDGLKVASAAHEVNNFAESLTNLVYLLQQNPKLDEDSRKYVTQIEAELERLRYIITQTLTRYRQIAGPAPVAVVEVLDTVLQVYKDQIASKNVQVEKRYDCDVRVMADFEDLRQVFANLIVNALQALQPTGKLAIHVRSCHGGSHAETVGVRVVISDNGVGIPPEHRSKVFLHDQRQTRQWSWPLDDFQDNSGARRCYQFEKYKRAGPQRHRFLGLSPFWR